MTTAGLLARLRSILDESSNGFWNDTNDLYGLLEIGQNECIQFLLAKQKEIRLIKPRYECESLKPLIKLDSSNTTTTGSSFQEYNLPSDFIETHSARYDPTSTASDLSKATLLGFDEIMWRQENTYLKSNISNPDTFYYYVRQTKLGFFPQPTGGAANKYQHYYYHNPTAIASGTNPTLLPETHEAILFFALSSAFMKDGNTNKSVYYRSEAIKKLEILL